MIFSKDGKCAEREGKYFKQRQREIDFCINKCPHGAESTCRYTPKQCMALGRREKA